MPFLILFEVLSQSKGSFLLHLEIYAIDEGDGMTLMLPFSRRGKKKVPKVDGRILISLAFEMTIWMIYNH